MRNALSNLVPYSDKFSRTKSFADRTGKRFAKINNFRGSRTALSSKSSGSVGWLQPLHALLHAFLFAP